MTNINSRLADATAGLEVGVDYETLADSGEANQAAVQGLIDLISQEATDGTDPARAFLDEMSPVCRDFLYAHLVALKAAIVDVEE